MDFNHTEKQKIFDKYAKEKGFDDMDDLITQFKYSDFSLKVMKRYMFEACDLVQQEQQKIIAENVETLYPYESITNPENLIK